MKRIALFLITNIALLLMLAPLMQLACRRAGPVGHGASLELVVLAAVAAVSVAGALLGLALSRQIAMRTLGIRCIDEPRSATESWLLGTVRLLAQRAGVNMPGVGVFAAPEPNALTTGPSRDRALLALSSGLLATHSRPQIQAVVGHEISHIASGDMVTLTLLQAVLNTLAVPLSWMVSNIVDRPMTRDLEGRGSGYRAALLFTRFGPGLLATILVMEFSRHREFRADAGGARLVGRDDMITGLTQLQRARLPGAPRSPLPVHLAVLGITGRGSGGGTRLFTDHAPLAERIAALRAGIQVAA